MYIYELCIEVIDTECVSSGIGDRPHTVVA